MSYLVAYLGALLVFGGLDLSWLRVMGRGSIVRRCRKSFLPICESRLLSFFTLPIQLVLSLLRQRRRCATDRRKPRFSGLLFGAIAYGTYDLTNHATLRNWTLQITIVDIVYGALVSAIAAIAAYGLVRATLGIPASS